MKKIEAFLQQAVKDSLELKKTFFAKNLDKLISFYETLRKLPETDGCVFIFGNGGSAADAQHFAAELMHRVENSSIGIRALALHTDTSLLTALSNDEGFEKVYARQIEVLAKRGDVVVAISTSGNSENVVEGLRVARKKGCKTAGLLGRRGGKALKQCDLALVVEHNSTPRIQEVHGMIIHFLCQLLERRGVWNAPSRG